MHADWLGHPWHAVAFPACSLAVPGQSERSVETVGNARCDVVTHVRKDIRGGGRSVRGIL